MTVGIYTLGCKVNTYESEFITSLLKNNGYIIKSFDEVCDIYIINTCTVTNNSDVKSRKMIRQARKHNKNALVIAMGCYIQAQNKSLNTIYSDADIIIGNKDKSKILELINKYFEGKKQLIDVYEDLGDKFEDMTITTFENRTRAFVKIQDGCRNFCSYCIIPYVRGTCRSKELTKVIEEVKELVANGYKEVVLTGIHTGNYGVDINTSFASLLKELVQIDGLKRLRISSIEITELNDEVLDIISKNDVIVNHLHIPIQAASDHVLKLMNRKYNLDYFIKKIELIKSLKKDISITTDIIAGFPNETEEDFNNSLDVIKKIGFSKLHVFPYSKRDGTVAAKMEQVDDTIKKERTKRLLELSRELELDYMKSFVGREVEVLVEISKDGCSIGHTSNYLQIKIMKDVIPHTFIVVKIGSIEYPYCISR